MRDFKFRVWDEGSGWYYSDEKGTDFVFSSRGVDVEYQERVYLSEGFTVEQYTGLKDRHGKEIYEGDIVDRVTEEGRETLGVVEYFTDLHWDGGGSVHPGFYFKEQMRDEWGHELNYGSGFDNEDWKWIEVIGNIHETPELL